MSKNSKPRRHERQLAFQVLYGLSFAPAQDEETLRLKFSECPNTRDNGETGGRETEGFAWELVLGVWTNREELDAVISRFSQHWRVERIAAIERSILRLALFEIIHRPDVPLKVAINEAVELAKQFGDENSRSFVNGILDAAAKAVEHGEIGVR
jgi:N utilization substance protein B